MYPSVMLRCLFSHPAAGRTHRLRFNVHHARGHIDRTPNEPTCRYGDELLWPPLK